MGILVHDINNLMTPMELLISFQETLINLMRIPQTEQNEKKAREIVEIIFNTLEKCKKDILTLVKMSLNQIQKVKFEHIKVKSKILPLLHEIIQELQCHPHLQGKHIEVRAEGEISDVLCNVLDIRRVLQNLLINAGYATEEYGKIDLVVKADKETLIINVIDRGAGISSEIIPYLLKMPISTKKDGNGLGLLSCKDIIEEGHNGKFWYESSPGKGTTFSFTLPLSPEIS
jgi:signal transduction histidine kinase